MVNMWSGIPRKTAGKYPAWIIKSSTIAITHKISKYKFLLLSPIFECFISETMYR